MKTLKRLLFFSALLFLLSCGNREEPVAKAVVPTTPLPQNRILRYLGPPDFPPGVGLTTQNGQIITRDGGAVVYENGRIERILSADPGSDSFRFIYDTGQLKEIQRHQLSVDGGTIITRAIRLFYTNARLTRVVQTNSSMDLYPDHVVHPSTIIDITYDGDNVSTISVQSGDFSVAGGAVIIYQQYKADYQYGNSYKNPFGTLPEELRIFNAHFGPHIFGDGLFKYYLLSKNPATTIVYSPLMLAPITRNYAYETDAAGYPVTLREYQSDIKQIFLYDTW